MSDTTTTKQQEQPAVELLDAGPPADPGAAGQAVDAALAQLPPAPAAQSAPPRAALASQAAPAPAPVVESPSHKSYDYGDEYPAGLHTLPDGRTLRKLDTGSWQDPTTKAFVKTPYPRPKRGPGRPRKVPTLTGPISQTAPGALPMQRTVTRETFAQASAVPSPSPASALPVQQPDAPNAEELRQNVHNAIEVTVGVVGKLLAHHFGEHAAVDDVEAETLADVWTPIAVKYLTPGQQAASPWLVAIVGTIGVVGPKITAWMEAAKLKQAEDATASARVA